MAELDVQRVATLIEHARQSGLSLLVLPDAVLGGYLTDLRRPDPNALPPALELDDPHLHKVAALAAEMVVCLGFCEADGDRRYNTALCVHGDGVLGSHRKVRAAALQVEPVVLGPVAHDALPALVAAAGVFAFPSTKEGFGLAALEALAAGVPLVVSNLPVLREISGAARFADDPTELAAQLRAALAEHDPGSPGGRPGARRPLHLVGGRPAAPRSLPPLLARVPFPLCDTVLAGYPQSGSLRERRHVVLMRP